MEPEVPINAACSCPACTEARLEGMLAERGRRIEALERELNGLADRNAHLKFELARARGEASGKAATIERRERRIKGLEDDLRLAKDAAVEAIRQRDEARAEIYRMMGVEDAPGGLEPDRGADRPWGESPKPSRPIPEGMELDERGGYRPKRMPATEDIREAIAAAARGEKIALMMVL